MRHRGLVPGRLRKSALVEALLTHSAARTLQRAFRSSGPVPCNDTDPITMQVIWRRPRDAAWLFRFTTASGQVFVYTPAVLAAYFVSSGDTRDPMSRQSLTLADVDRLAAQQRAPARADELRRCALPQRGAEPEPGAEATPVTVLLDDLVHVVSLNTTQSGEIAQEAGAQAAIDYIFMSFGPCMDVAIQLLREHRPGTSAAAVADAHDRIRALARTVRHEALQLLLLLLSSSVLRREANYPGERVLA